MISIGHYSELIQSIRHKDITTVKNIIDLYSDKTFLSGIPDYDEYLLTTPPILMASGILENSEIIGLIIDNCVDINQYFPSTQCSTPLFYSVISGQPGNFIYLLNRGADISIRNYLKQTALIYAINNSKLSIVLAYFNYLPPGQEFLKFHLKSGITGNIPVKGDNSSCVNLANSYFNFIRDTIKFYETNIGMITSVFEIYFQLIVISNPDLPESTLGGIFYSHLTGYKGEKGLSQSELEIERDLKHVIFSGAGWENINQKHLLNYLTLIENTLESLRDIEEKFNIDAVRSFVNLKFISDFRSKFIVNGLTELRDGYPELIGYPLPNLVFQVLDTWLGIAKFIERIIGA